MDGNPNFKLQCLTLFDPWTRMYRVYRFTPAGMKLIRSFGPASPAGPTTLR